MAPSLVESTNMTNAEDSDCWYGVKDPAARKKIQNRLAQRARRQRLARQRGEHYSASISPAPSSSSSSSRTATFETTQYMALERSPMACMSVVCVPSTKPSEGTIATEVSPSVFAALFDNGAMMGLSCSSVVPGKSHRVGEEIPLALRPTALQLTTIHARWIDRFPFPKLRDNMITLSGIIDEEEFLRDLFGMDSFTVKPGKAGWDPTGWVIGKEFAKKWGYLFY